MRFMKEILLCVVSYILVPQALANGQVDTGGVSLGMSPTQVQGAAKKMFKSDQDGFVTFSGTKKIGAYFATRADQYNYSVEKGMDQHLLLVNFSTNSQKAVSIVRKQSFAKTSRPNPEVLSASLVKKYGEPSLTIKNHNGIYLTWQFNLDGSLQKWKSPSEGRVCDFQINPRSVNGFEFMVPETFKSDCGIFIRAHLDPETTFDTKLVETLEITLVNHQIAYVDLKKDADAKALERVENDRKRVKESENIKVNL
jgi:hypothetical protein